MTETHFLIKFGEIEHLKKLKQGKIYFNAISNYRNDTTLYRGDFLEGKIPINPSSLKIYDKNGINIFEHLPMPDRAEQSIVGDDNLLMFCCAIVTDNILLYNKHGKYTLKDEFKKEMRKFGDYAIGIWESELIDKMMAACNRNQNLLFESRAITYHDKSTFTPTDIYLKKNGLLAPYFVKDVSYQWQNEWRIILDGKYTPLPLNRNRGYLVETTPFKTAVIMEAERFLDGFEVAYAE